MDWTRPRVAIIADSWFKDHRIHSIKAGETSTEGWGLLELAPHELTAMTGFEEEVSTSKALLLNLARGTLTMRRVMERSDYIRKWAEFVPEVTVVGLGACDLISEGLRFQSPQKDFPEHLLTFLLRLKEAAILHMTPTQWMSWSRRHRFLVLRPSDWAEFVSTSATLSAEGYRVMRRAIGKGLKRNASRLYQEAGAVVLAPAVGGAEVDGVHLVAVAQRQLNREVAAGVARLLCNECRLPDDFLLGAYKRILDDTICSLRPQRPRVSERVAFVAAVLRRAAPEQSVKRKRVQRKHVTFAEGVTFME